MDQIINKTAGRVNPFNMGIYFFKIELFAFIAAFLAVCLTTRNFSTQGLINFLPVSMIVIIQHLLAYSISDHPGIEQVYYGLQAQLPIFAVIYGFKSLLRRKGNELSLLCIILTTDFFLIFSSLIDELNFEFVIMGITASILISSKFYLVENLSKSMDHLQFWDQQLRISAFTVLGMSFHYLSNGGLDANNAIISQEKFDLFAVSIFMGAVAIAVNGALNFFWGGYISSVVHLASYVLICILRNHISVALVLGVILFLLSCALLVIKLKKSIKNMSIGLSTKTLLGFQDPDEPEKKPKYSQRHILLCGLYFLALLHVWRDFLIPSLIYRRSLDSLEKDGCFVDPRKVSQYTLLQDGFSSAAAIEEECASHGIDRVRKCQVPKALHLMMAGGNFKEHHYYSVTSLVKMLKPELVFVHGYDFPFHSTLFNLNFSSSLPEKYRMYLIDL